MRRNSVLNGKPADTGLPTLRDKRKQKEDKMKDWIKKQLSSKTNITTALAVLFFVLKHYGLVDQVPDGFELGAAALVVVNVVIKILKTIYYKIKAAK